MHRVGGLSAINGIAGAYSDDLPVILISGGPNYLDAQSRHIIHHTIGERELYQQSKCFEPIVAKTFVIRHLNDCAPMIDSAIETALKLRKPVYLEVPVNLATAKINAPIDIVSPKTYETPSSDPVSLATAKEDVLNALNAAVKPVILVGSKIRSELYKNLNSTNPTASTSSVYSSDGNSLYSEDLLGLVDQLQCAVAVMPDAKGLFPESHPNYIGRYWSTVSSEHVAEVVESADLVVLVGANINDYTTTGWSALLNKNKCIYLNKDHVNIGDNYYPNVQLLDMLRELVSGNILPYKPGSLTTYQRYANITPTNGSTSNDVYSNDGNGASSITTGDFDPNAALTLRFLQQAVQQSLTPNTTLLTETGDAWFIGQSLKIPDGSKYMVQMQYGSIGWSVGAVLGVGIAEGDNRRVMLLVGDGSFQMTAQEISTLIRYNTRATIILLNNKGYTIEVQIHDGAYNDIKNWKYAELVNVFNAEDGNGLALTAGTNQEFVEALQKSEQHDGLSFIECFLDRDDCTKELLEWGSRVCKANGRR
jgi:pyruvate decarboxylase